MSLQSSRIIWEMYWNVLDYYLFSITEHNCWKRWITVYNKLIPLDLWTPSIVCISKVVCSLWCCSELGDFFRIYLLVITSAFLQKYRSWWYRWQRIRCLYVSPSGFRGKVLIQLSESNTSISAVKKWGIEQWARGY